VYIPLEEVCFSSSGEKTGLSIWLEALHPSVRVGILPSFRANVFDNEATMISNDNGGAPASSRGKTIKPSDRSFFSLSLSKLDLLEHHLFQHSSLRSVIWVDMDTMVVLDMYEIYNGPHGHFVLCGFPQRKRKEKLRMGKNDCYGDLFMADLSFLEKLRRAEERFGKQLYVRPRAEGPG